MELTPEQQADLRRAKHLLETPSLATKVSSAIGRPIEQGFELLPARWSEVVQKATRASLQRALDLATATLDDQRRDLSLDRIHKALVATTGAAGGAFGLPALGLELPMSTALMLRSIADIARSQGESIRTVETKLACLQVFALGGPTREDDAVDAGYFAVRAALGRTISDAIRHLQTHGVSGRTAPALVRLISAITARFGVVVSQKVAAQAVPLVGAAGGAIINTLFIDHYQNMARGHFTVRRLERACGRDRIERAYRDLQLET